MEHYKVTFQPDERQISIHAGATVLEAAGLAGIVLNTVCGGKGTCGKCKVILEPTGQQIQACQYQIEKDLTITIPISSRLFEQKILTDAIGQRIHLGPAEVTAEKARANLGLTVDIGTTTVVAKLMDLSDGRCLATEGAINPQVKFGDDVVSRINYAQTEDKLAELQKLVIDCINELIAKICEKANIIARQISHICVVGNTTMNHIFLKLPVGTLGQAPYKAHSLDAYDVSAESLGLNVNPIANVHTVENIAGFVGSDITAAALAVDIDSVEETTLLVDIGTNGEVVLATDSEIYATSCAAGPAFEGARISCGSRAMAGAIEAVVFDGSDIDINVIGNSVPHSICGSGLIDAVAVLLDLGVIDATGRFAKKEELKDKVTPAVLSRMTKIEEQPAFCLSDVKGQGIFLTQSDIRQTQLAKAAIRAGIKLLQRKLSLADSDIKQIQLAGAFGNYIKRESALRIGLLPDVPAECIHFVGNAATAGAQMVLLSEKYKNKAGELAGRIEYVEIANEKDFTEIYADCMGF